MNSKKRILFIDSDVVYAQSLAEYLIKEGFDVSIHNKAEKVCLESKRIHFDIILLDILTPKFDNFELLKKLRSYHSCPIVVITEEEEHFDHVFALEIGADDYLLKSIHHRILRARLNALMRRGEYPKKTINNNLLCINNISLCQATRKSYFKDKALDLTGAEFNVLFYLMSFAGQTISKEAIANDVLGQALSYYNRCIDMHICNIRRKISLISSDVESEKIKTIRGAGYIFLLSASNYEAPIDANTDKFNSERMN